MQELVQEHLERIFPGLEVTRISGIYGEVTITMRRPPPLMAPEEPPTPFMEQAMRPVAPASDDEVQF